MTDRLPSDLPAIAHRLFADYAATCWPDEDWALLEALSRAPSPWYDAARSRWIVSDPDQVHQVLSDGGYSNRLGPALASTVLAAVGFARDAHPEPVRGGVRRQQTL